MSRKSDRRELRLMRKYANHYEDIYCCESCFRYSKFPEQWEKTMMEPARCSSCGKGEAYYAPVKEQPTERT